MAARDGVEDVPQAPLRDVHVLQLSEQRSPQGRDPRGTDGGTAFGRPDPEGAPPAAVLQRPSPPPVGDDEWRSVPAWAVAPRPRVLVSLGIRVRRALVEVGVVEEGLVRGWRDDLSGNGK